MNRRLVIALACATIAMGGCATSLETSHNASSTGSIRVSDRHFSDASAAQRLQTGSTS